VINIQKCLELVNRDVEAKYTADTKYGTPLSYGMTVSVRAYNSITKVVKNVPPPGSPYNGDLYYFKPAQRIKLKIVGGLKYPETAGTYMSNRTLPLRFISTSYEIMLYIEEKDVELYEKLVGKRLLNDRNDLSICQDAGIQFYYGYFQIDNKPYTINLKLAKGIQ